MKTQSEESYLQAKERGLEQSIPWWPSEGTNPADTLILDFQTLALRGNKFLLFQPPSLW